MLLQILMLLFFHWNLKLEILKNSTAFESTVHLSEWQKNYEITTIPYTLLFKSFRSVRFVMRVMCLMLTKVAFIL